LQVGFPNGSGKKSSVSSEPLDYLIQRPPN
jgi:hypothetical protein